ncbi:hypothetical protein AYI69_g10484 [Smittium culicis]|uniref:Uncharacterized protein n=1 Tax=Smittium culicis TaxID=133412 RepID=A0A1R1X5C6_9FUNG|nr:hypothetical protein AYI69_g10484 [Smittium culicis]
MKEQIEAIRRANDQHSELIEAMNAMRLEGQSVVAELESTKNKNKTLLKEKNFLEKVLESISGQNILATDSLELEKKKLLAMNDLLEKQKELISSIHKRAGGSSSRTGKVIPLPLFEGKPLEFRSWIGNFDDYFNQYNYIADFEKKT